MSCPKKRPSESRVTSAQASLWKLELCLLSSSAGPPVAALGSAAGLECRELRTGKQPTQGEALGSREGREPRKLWPCSWPGRSACARGGGIQSLVWGGQPATQYRAAGDPACPSPGSALTSLASACRKESPVHSCVAPLSAGTNFSVSPRSTVCLQAANPLTHAHTRTHGAHTAHTRACTPS